MKFLIIGASGFIGRHILSFAKGQGYEVLGTASSAHHKEGLIGFNLASDRLKEKIPESFFCSNESVFVIISAMISQIDKCRKNSSMTRILNVDKTIQLMEDVQKLGAKPVYLSSSFVFNGKDGYYTERDVHSPVCEYGRQKAAIESYCSSKHADWFVARLDKVVGDDPAENHIFSEWQRWSQGGGAIVCIDRQIFAPTLVDDVAKAVIKGCHDELARVYNISNNEYFTREDLALQFKRIMNVDATVITKTQQELGFLDLRPEKSYLDSSRFFQATNMTFCSMRKVIERFKAKIENDGLLRL